MRRAYGLLLLIAGCIQIPDEPAPECYADSDCNVAAGEACQEGVCYGDPPKAMFAIAINPPGNSDLASVERASEQLPADGFMTDLTLEAPVVLTAQVTAAACAPPTSTADCPTGALPASLTISRPSRFPGGDGFVATQTSTDGTSVTVPVPRTRQNDPRYTVTVVPADRKATAAGSASPAPAELVPPLRTTLAATSDMPLPLALGGAELPIVSGDLEDADGTPLVGYRVSALGRWTGDTADSEVSSVDYTPDGNFQIQLSAGLVGPVTIVAAPVDATAIAPTLRLIGVDSTRSSTQHLQQPTAVGVQRVVSVTIQGTSGNGAVTPIAGATVLATASVTAGVAPGPGANLSAVVAANVATGSDGVAILPLLDGTAYSAGYDLRVIPPPNSNLAVFENVAYPLGDATIVLKQRVELEGKVLDAGGRPVRDVSVTVRPSLLFQWSLADAAQVFLAQVPAATDVTTEDGGFHVFVDPYIGETFAHYDLTFEPPSGSTVPSYLLQAFEVPGGTLAGAVLQVTGGEGSGSAAPAAGTVQLPDAAALHGVITDPTGTPVEGAELRVFRVPAVTGGGLCGMNLPNKPANCQVPAQLQAHATADQDGIVRFTLPR